MSKAIEKTTPFSGPRVIPLSGLCVHRTGRAANHSIDMIIASFAPDIVRTYPLLCKAHRGQAPAMLIVHLKFLKSFSFPQDLVKYRQALAHFKLPHTDKDISGYLEHWDRIQCCKTFADPKGEINQIALSGRRITSFVFQGCGIRFTQDTFARFAPSLKTVGFHDCGDLRTIDLRNVPDLQFFELRTVWPLEFVLPKESNLSLTKIVCHNRSLRDPRIVPLISKCPALHTADISNALDIGDPTLLSLPKALRALTLAKTGVTDAGLLQCKFSQMECMSLEGCRQIGDTGIEALGQISTLTYVNLGDTRMTNVGAVKLSQGCPQLRTCLLHGTRISDPTLEALGKHNRQLETLCIDYCDQCTQTGMQAISSLPLTCLSIVGCRLMNPDIIIVHFPKLVGAFFSNTNLSDLGLREFARCKQLRVLSINRCGRITFSGVVKAVRLFSQSFYLSGADEEYPIWRISSGDKVVEFLSTDRIESYVKLDKPGIIPALLQNARGFPLPFDELPPTRRVLGPYMKYYAFKQRIKSAS